MRPINCFHISLPALKEKFLDTLVDERKCKVCRAKGSTVPKRYAPPRRKTDDEVSSHQPAYQINKNTMSCKKDEVLFVRQDDLERYCWSRKNFQTDLKNNDVQDGIILEVVVKKRYRVSTPPNPAQTLKEIR